MKSSLAQTTNVEPAERTLLEYGDREFSSAISTGPAIDFPRFDSLAVIRPQAVRMAGRINAASISEAEHNALLRERQRLLDRKFAGELTRQESNRLEYVRWSLDRIEDARHGDALDSLEASVANYERFLSDLQALDRKIRQPVVRAKK